jgi:hypothetical protein
VQLHDEEEHPPAREHAKPVKREQLQRRAATSASAAPADDFPEDNRERIIF